MKILLVHGFYQTRGGEDAVVENERAMLERRGHTVIPFFVKNAEISSYSFFEKLMVPPSALYNPKSARRFVSLLASKAVDIVHIHNIWPLVSPSIFVSLNRRGVPYLQTLHNYRYIVPNALLYKNDVAPEDRRLTVAPRPGNSFRQSYILSAAYRLTAALVRRGGLIDNGCGALQVLNRFSYDVYKQHFNPEKLFIRGNFLPDDVTAKMVPMPKEDVYLYLGRLSEEKGVLDLINAFAAMETDAKLHIAGGGPLEQRIKAAAAHHPNIRFLGIVRGEAKRTLLARAKALVVPSTWQEVFPVTIMEANFSGTPVLAARIGGLPDMVDAPRSGCLFESGDVASLKGTLEWCDANPGALEQMGTAARAYARERFGESESYTRLMEIYEHLINAAAGRPPRR